MKNSGNKNKKNYSFKNLNYPARKSLFKALKSEITPGQRFPV